MPPHREASDDAPAAGRAATIARASGRRLTALDSAGPAVFEAIFTALDESSRSVIGPAKPRLLVIPIHDDAGAVGGGLWGYTLFGWLHVQMLFVPEALRNLGVGSALLAAAESEARIRGCCGAHLDAFSFQAAPFYQRLGYRLFGRLADFPPGHERLYFYKPLGAGG